MTIDLRHGDCLDIMPTIPDASVDMVLTDLPYGITRNAWDVRIPMGPLWEQWGRLLRPGGLVVLTASQPFSSELVNSNPSAFRHEWIWVKNRGSNFANTIREPFKEHEHVLVFSPSGKRWTYNPIKQERAETGKSRVKYRFNLETESENYNRFTGTGRTLGELRGPSSVQRFNVEVGLHPTQKPVALFEYLIRTYTDPGMTVLDCCMGSGTAGVAAKSCGRSFIGIEMDEGYFALARERIDGTEGPMCGTTGLDVFAEGSE